MSVPTIRVSEQAQSVPVRAFIQLFARTAIVLTGSGVFTGSTIIGGDRYGPKYAFYQANDTGSATLVFCVSQDGINYTSTGSATCATANIPICLSLTDPWNYTYAQVTASDWGDFGQTGSIWLTAKTMNS